MPEGQDHSARPSMASPSVESPNPSLRRGREGTNELFQAHQPGTGLDRPCHGARFGAELPHAERSLQLEPGSEPGSLADSILNETPGYLAPPVGTATSGRVAAGPHAMEEVQPEAESAHSATPEDVAFNQCGEIDASCRTLCTSCTSELHQ